MKLVSRDSVRLALNTETGVRELLIGMSTVRNEQSERTRPGLVGEYQERTDGAVTNVGGITFQTFEDQTDKVISNYS